MAVACAVVLRFLFPMFINPPLYAFAFAFAFEEVGVDGVCNSRE